jgi:hypothetical protein
VGPGATSYWRPSNAQVRGMGKGASQRSRDSEPSHSGEHRGNETRLSVPLLREPEPAPSVYVAGPQPPKSTRLTLEVDVLSVSPIWSESSSDAKSWELGGNQLGNMLGTWESDRGSRGHRHRANMAPISAGMFEHVFQLRSRFRPVSPLLTGQRGCSDSARFKHSASLRPRRQIATIEGSGAHASRSCRSRS